MADNIPDFSSLVGLAINSNNLMGLEENPQAGTISGQSGVYEVSFTYAYTASTAPTDYGTIISVSGNQITFDLPVFFGQYTWTVIAHSSEGLLVQTDFGVFPIVTNNFLNDQTVQGNGATPDGNGDINGSVTWRPSETSDPAPFGLACFAEGVLIATTDGERSVESLKVGDVVLTASGETRAVRWIGTSDVQPRWLRMRGQDVNPVRVRAGAFGAGLPVRDLRLSPGHAVHVEGVLVPVGLLVNGATIVREEVDRIRYFHIELESHDILLADGLPCESYLDDGNREGFADVGLDDRLDPKNWDDACAPMVAAGPQLTQIQQRLHAEAEAQGWVKNEAADLIIEADGAMIAPLHQSGSRFWFAVPAAQALTLRSSCGVLAHVMPGLSDGRMLGVAVAELRIDGAALDLDHAAFGKGFYPTERHKAIGWRWTDGAASLGLSLDQPTMVEVALAMIAPSWKRRASELRLVATN